MNRKIANILLIISLGFFSVLGVVFIVIPIVTDYEFETVTKNSKIYDEPIFITFHWKTTDELQVGKLITLWAEIKGLPYAEKNQLEKDIVIMFDETQINYFGKEIQNKEISKIDYMTFRSDWNNNSIKSNEIDLRFIIPTDIKIQYCDYNLKDECVLVENIIHPAPHDLAVQIDTNRIGIAVSLAVASFSSIVVWATLRVKL